MQRGSLCRNHIFINENRLNTRFQFINVRAITRESGEDEREKKTLYYYHNKQTNDYRL